MRLATQEDVDFILACFALPHARSFLRAPDRKQLVRALADGDMLHLILEMNGARAGILRLRSIAKNWAIAELSLLIATQPRAGAGRFMTEFAKRFAFEERKAHRLCLEFVSANEPARKLYESCGFVREGTFREGFPADDGTFADLEAYGMLAREFRTGVW